MQKIWLNGLKIKQAENDKSAFLEIGKKSKESASQEAGWNSDESGKELREGQSQRRRMLRENNGGKRENMDEVGGILRGWKKHTLAIHE